MIKDAFNFFGQTLQSEVKNISKPVFVYCLLQDWLLHFCIVFIFRPHLYLSIHYLKCDRVSFHVTSSIETHGISRVVVETEPSEVFQTINDSIFGFRSFFLSISDCRGRLRDLDFAFIKYVNVSANRVAHDFARAAD